jgi:hypothetical protein
MTTFMKEFLGFSIYVKNLKVEERLADVSDYFRNEDNWATVVSSAVAAISYYRPKDKKQSGSILAVRFVNGRTYWYSGVYVNIFSQFVSTDSKGRFVNFRIKKRYPFVEM